MLGMQENFVVMVLHKEMMFLMSKRALAAAQSPACFAQITFPPERVLVGDSSQEVPVTVTTVRTAPVSQAATHTKTEVALPFFTCEHDEVRVG